VCDHLESVAVLVEDRTEMICIIDENLHVVELVASVQVGQNSPRRLFRRGRKQPDVEEFVRFWINRAVQPELLTVEADLFSSTAS